MQEFLLSISSPIAPHPAPQTIIRFSIKSLAFVIFGVEVAHFVLENDESLEILRGRILSANQRNFIVTFHIGDLLKNQSLKKLALSDFNVAKDYLAKIKN